MQIPLAQHSILNAIKNGDIKTIKKKAKTLPDDYYIKDLNIKIQTPFIESSLNPVQYAVYHNQLPVMKLLRREYKVPHTQSCRGLGSPLHIACWKGNLEIVRYLLRSKKVIKKNLNEWVQGFGNETPLRWACKSDKNYDIVRELLMAGADVWDRDGTGKNQNALDVAAESGSAKILSYLLPFYLNPPADPDNGNRIFTAIKSCFTTAIKGVKHSIIIKMFTNQDCAHILSSIIDTPLIGGWTALHILARKSRPHPKSEDRLFLEKITASHLWMSYLMLSIGTLLNRGADPLVVTATGLKPVDFARKYGEAEVVMVLEKAEKEKMEKEERSEEVRVKKGRKRRREERERDELDSLVAKGYNRRMIEDLLELHSGDVEEVMIHMDGFKVPC